MSNHETLTPRECALRLKSITSPLVVMHVRPDADTVGTAAALCEIFRALGREPVYACADSIPQRLAFLLEDYVEARESDYLSRSVVCVDVSAPVQLGAIRDKLPEPVLMIDHHEVGTPFAAGLIIPGESSAAEVLMRVVEELMSDGLIELTPRLAYPLYAGISSDTGCFRFSNVSPRTLRTAARLIECGIDFSDINHRLFSSKSFSQLRAEGLVAERISCAFGGKVSYACVSAEDRSREGVPFSDFDTAIDIVRSLDGAEIAFVVKETDEGEFKVSLRSTGKDVASVAARFGGGGHIRAAGCTVKAADTEAAAALIINALSADF